MLNSFHYLKYLLGLDVPITQTTIAERNILKNFATGKKRLAEIGIFHGVNTLAFREVMSPDAILIAVDPFERSFFGIRGYGWARRIAHQEVSKSKNGKVVWIECTGAEAPTRQELACWLPVDFLFIDGDHSFDGLRRDWESWSPNVIKDGIIAIHDSINRNNCGSEKFTNEVVLKNSDFELLCVVDSLSILRKL